MEDMEDEKLTSEEVCLIVWWKYCLSDKIYGRRLHYKIPQVMQSWD